MLGGVSMEDPDSTYISPDVKIGKDTIIYPNTTIFGNTVIGNKNEIGPNAVLENVTIGNNNIIKSVTLSDVIIGDDQSVK